VAFIQPASRGLVGVEWANGTQAVRPTHGVTEVLEGHKNLTEFLDGVEGMDPSEVLLEGLSETSRGSVAFELACQGRGALDPQEPQFALEYVGKVGVAMAMAERQACGDPAAYPPKCSRMPWRVASSSSKRSHSLRRGSRYIRPAFFKQDSIHRPPGVYPDFLRRLIHW